MTNNQYKLNRRECLGGMGLGSIALASLLAEQQAVAAGRPLDSAQKLPLSQARAKNVIFLFMVGGVSHLDTFDYKPALGRYAGKFAHQVFSDEELQGFNPEKNFSDSLLLPSVYPFGQHGQSGHWVSDIYPHVARVVDEIAMVKSMRVPSPLHSVGQVLMHTGFDQPGFPSLGAWVGYGLGSENRDMPGFVVMRDGPATDSGGGPAMWQSGFLPGNYQATLVETKEGHEPIRYLRRREGVSIDQQRRQLDLLLQLNRLHKQERLAQGELGARIDAFETAFGMQAAAPALFDISQESASVRTFYGATAFGNQCLIARRLVEHGVRFVEIFDGAVGRRWDAHGGRGGLLDNHRTNAARTDRAIAALIQDLKSRGLLDETLVVWATEFGRTPFEEESGKKANRKLGRGHHHYGFTMWMAGGGVRGGLSYGATDELGMHAVENPVSHHDLHATILYLLGLDHERLSYRHNGRDFRLTDVGGRVVHELLA